MSDLDLQTELSRLQCLQALGITLYHPRYRLPGAKPSVRGPWPDAAADVAARAAPAPDATATTAPRVETPRTAQVTPPKRVEVALPAAAEIKPVSTPRAAASTAERLAEKEPAQNAVQNFQLLFFQVDDDLAIVNQVPALARPQLQDRQMALLSNLLRWLGKSAPMQAPRVFRWPLPGLEHMAASMSAQTSLLHFLEQAASERGFRFLLQLGPQAVTPAVSAWQSFATHSLDEMLALPSLKREAWQALLPLHAALQ
jgi:hypothetical protein